MNSTPMLGSPLPPPAGGFERLRSRILERRRRARALTLCIAVAMSIPFFIVRPDPPMSKNPTEISVANGAALEWPSSKPDVRIFLIAQAQVAGPASPSDKFDESR